MQLINSISKYATIFFVMLVILAVIVGAVAYYLLKIKKIASKEEQFDYSRFDRKDSVDYVRFDQIINAVENNIRTNHGLIILKDGYQYITGIKVNGYNFFSASAQEQRQSMSGMISFLNAVEGDIQFRQSTKAIDLSSNIEIHKKRLKEIELEIYGLQMDHEDLVTKAEEFLTNPSIYANYDARITAIEKNIKCKRHTQEELDMVIQYMESLSGTNLESEKVQCWLFEWQYNANDYTEELTDEEKYQKAASALTTKANSYISALQRTGCTCERMSGDEILELFRYHYSPITADSFKISELYDSSVNTLFVTSDSLEKLKQEETEEREYYDALNEQRILEAQQKEMYAQQQEQIKREWEEKLAREEAENAEEISLSEETDNSFLNSSESDTEPEESPEEPLMAENSESDDGELFTFAEEDNTEFSEEDEETEEMFSLESESEKTYTDSEKPENASETEPEDDDELFSFDDFSDEPSEDMQTNVTAEKAEESVPYDNKGADIAKTPSKNGQMSLLDNVVFGNNF